MLRRSCHASAAGVAKMRLEVENPNTTELYCRILCIIRAKRSITLDRIDALIAAAVKYLTEGAPPSTDGILHRLDKFDTKQGLASVQYAGGENAPYAVLLYERYLGRP